MSSMGNHHLLAHTHSHGTPTHSLHPIGHLGPLSRSRTPNPLPSQSSNTLPEAEIGIEDDPRSLLFKDLFARAEAKIETLFGGDGTSTFDENHLDAALPNGDTEPVAASGSKPPSKKAARTIDEDDYDDPDDEDGEEEEEEEEGINNESPLKAKSTGTNAVPRVSSPSKGHGVSASPAHNSNGSVANGLQWQGKTSEDARKKLEEQKKAAEEAARKSFHTLFYGLENDRDAMLEQQRLEESERQVDAEMSGNSTSSNANAVKTLSQANLGTSSLVLKHLIARIDQKRAAVSASDQELRNLMIEVKKNRSKWASEDKIGQEDLYEAAEKVLSEIKAMTEHSQPFLQRVNKREAPDYYNIIKHPMDLSTMTKKLKAIQYKSKKEFVDDLNLIWANCLKYNANPEHFLRRHALAMRKETEKLVPLIPDIVIRDRAEVEAEERRKEAAEHEAEGGEDSDDEPIIASRGRKAPAKKAKKGGPDAAQDTEVREGTPQAESKPMVNGVGSAVRHDLIRAESDSVMDGSQNGLNTPPPGTITPAGAQGLAASSQVDGMDMDGITSMTGIGQFGAAEAEYEDTEHKMWKHVTKKDRALAAAERHRLFKGDKLNVEEPALLRSKAGMRRWLRLQKEAEETTVLGKRKREQDDDEGRPPGRETLAEGMEGTDEATLPDYYDTMNAIPDVNPRLQWDEDSEGYVVPHSEETLRIVPDSFFKADTSILNHRLQANMKQMQDTRKICSKIGVVKQMQLQTQMYQNQFQKYESLPLVDGEMESIVVSDDAPTITASYARASMQRAVAKIFFATGFEECQPSAIEAVTDIASDYFVKLARTLQEYTCVPKVPVEHVDTNTNTTTTTWKPKYTLEESLLQSLWDHGIDLEVLESYVKDDTDRVTNKLGTLHERMKSYLAELLRPALQTESGPAGDTEFNDGSQQFVGGDFAEELQEDFFGFKELGLDKEFGLSGFSVPLHLLQNRMHTAYQSQNASDSNIAALTLPTPQPLQPVTATSLTKEIGLVHNFFQNKLHTSNEQALVEDEDLPQKQRLPKPRLPPTGKITSPRKKAVREPGPGKGHPKKKWRPVEGQGWVKESELSEKEKAEKMNKGNADKGSKLKNVTNANDNRNSDAEGDNDDEAPPTSDKKVKVKVNGTSGEGGMISPESLEA